ncbi:MAG: NEW3 domain-containing protein, partial [bacterium]
PPGIQPTNYTTTTCRILDINSNNPIENYNVSFWINDNYLGSNITNSTGYSSFKFNYSTLGSHTTKCNITDEDDMYYKASLSDELTDNLNVVASPDVYSPKLLSYGINESEIMRNQCVLVYGQWDEEINYSKVIYNMSDTFTQKHIEPPYIGNWSNITLCTNNSWHVGVKELKLWANDTVGNINKSVPYLNFTLNGRSAIEWISPIAIGSRDEIDLVCRVYDFDNNHNISGYNVVFLDDDGALIGNNQTMDDGKAIMKYDATFLDTGDYTFRCQIQTAPTLYYPTRSVSFAEQTLTFATINTSLNIFDTTDFETKYQNENVTFYANFTDNNGLAKDGICNITIYDYNYNHTNNMIFNNVTDYYEYNYSFNYSGMYDWNVSCNSLDSEAITKNSTAIIYDNLPPIINLITPINNAIIDYQDTIVFYYNVSDESGVENCSLFINGELNQTNDTILMDTTLNFSIDNLMPSNYNWSILCYDQSSLNNQANSEIRNLTIGGAKVIFDIINYPNYVFRNDNSVEFTINVTNNGTLNATDTNITFKIPNDWQFSTGNSTDQIVTIDINESVLVSWHVDIPNFASFGEKQINFSSNLTTPGVNDYLSLFVNVSTIDLSIDEIISPLNNSCTYDNLFILANITNNDNISKDNVNITLLINGTYKDSKIENFTNYKSRLINFSNVFVNESYYNITLLVDEINDINFDDNVMSIFVNRYYKDLTYNFTSSSISDNVYNQSYTIINNKDCDLEFGSLYGFIDNDFVFDYSVPLSNSSYGVIGSYNGDIYQWNNTIPALSFVNGYYIVNGINNYHANLLYITGITVG